MTVVGTGTHIAEFIAVWIFGKLFSDQIANLCTDIIRCVVEAKTKSYSAK